jgi:hypothetical protein
VRALDRAVKWIIPTILIGLFVFYNQYSGSSIRGIFCNIRILNEADAIKIARQALLERYPSGNPYRNIGEFAARTPDQDPAWRTWKTGFFIEYYWQVVLIGEGADPFSREYGVVEISECGAVEMAGGA